MKLFILTLTLLCFSQAQPVNQQKLNELGNCAEYTIGNGVITGCKTCHTGYQKNGDGKCVFNKPATIPYPAKDCDADGKCTFYDIRYDGDNGVCSNKIDLVNSEGVKLNDVEATCLACATFNGQNSCAKCATGYILKGDKCIPLDKVELFGQGDPTNQNCIHGYHDGSGKCDACIGQYTVDNSKCIKNQNIEGDKMNGCISGYIDNNKNYICLQCREGYIFDKKTNTCKKLPNDKCVDGILDQDNKYICSKCMPGYFLQDDKCEKCEMRENLATLKLSGDECNLLPYSSCDQCNPKCEKDGSTSMCVSRHCDLLDSENKCVRCEQGYVLDANGKCLFSDDCRNMENELCEKGYYEANENGEKVCKKCKGNCIECYSDTICKEGKSIHKTGYALNGYPCFDPNCDLCSSEDRRICLKCKPYDSNSLISEDTVLKNGRCYAKYRAGYMLGSVNQYNACRFFEEPAYAKDTSKTITEALLDGSYIQMKTVAFTHNKNKEGDSYLCEYHDNLPYYFQHNGDTIQCAGKNRDLTNDCKCKEGYYADNVHKFSDCIEFTKFRHCAEPLSANICGKCKEGLKMTSYKDESGNTQYECGCEDGYRADSNGVCIRCPENCSTCRTNKDGNAQCFKCKGYVTSSMPNIEMIVSNNYYRDLSKECKCIEGYASLDKSGDTVYTCHKIPAECPDGYTVGEINARCTSCPKEGFDYTSDCKECLGGYYKEGSGESAVCKKCPAIDGTTVSGCSSCSIKQGATNPTCDSCLDGNMDQSSNCKKCRSGYTLKFRRNGIDNNNTDHIPFCLECDSWCVKEGQDAGCFYDEVGAKEDKNNKNKGTFADPYTLEFTERTDVKKFCYKCVQEGKSIWDHCECGEGLLKDGDKCKSCLDVSKEEAYKQLDLSKCDLAKGCSIDISSAEFKCAKCATGYDGRSVSSNCLKCKDTKQYPVTAGTQGSNGGCMACDSHCVTCDSKDKCTSCPQAKKEDSGLIVGDKCDQCAGGYFKNGMVKSTMEEYKDKTVVKCDKCDETCVTCFGTSKNCSACIGEHNLPSETNACNQCVKGYFYDPINKECNQVTTANGFLESELVCKWNKNNTLFNCKLVVEWKIEKETYTSAERAIKCDTSIKGVAAEPVDGKCVCKKGFFDTRTAEQIALSPRPECIDVRNLTSDDFCVHAKNNNGKYECLTCNAEYLELVNGKCTCKKGYYTSSWGACIPCNRHMKGCTECEKCVNGERGDKCFNKKPTCKKCESGYTLQNGECKA